jgi:hypothetical protein
MNFEQQMAWGAPICWSKYTTDKKKERKTKKYLLFFSLGFSDDAFSLRIGHKYFELKTNRDIMGVDKSTPGG